MANIKELERYVKHILCLEIKTSLYFVVIKCLHLQCFMCSTPKILFTHFRSLLAKILYSWCIIVQYTFKIIVLRFSRVQGSTPWNQNLARIFALSVWTSNPRAAGWKTCLGRTEWRCADIYPRSYRIFRYRGILLSITSALRPSYPGRFR